MTQHENIESIFSKRNQIFLMFWFFFFNYLKNLDIQLSAVLRSDWAEKILSVKIQKLLKNNETKWKLSVSHIQHQNEIFKHSIQMICRQNRTVIIQTKLFKKIWTKIMNNVIFLTNISFTSTELFSELIELIKKITILWKTWENISYNSQKNIQKIDINVYIQMKDFKFKKISKLLFWRKKWF